MGSSSTVANQAVAYSSGNTSRRNQAIDDHHDDVVVRGRYDNNCNNQRENRTFEIVTNQQLEQQKQSNNIDHIADHREIKLRNEPSGATTTTQYTSNSSNREVRRKSKNNNDKNITTTTSDDNRNDINDQDDGCEGEGEGDGKGKGKFQEKGKGKRREENFQLLAKNSFTCLVLGSRQTGKRTIVKCFVKLVNEFRLAADEYRKEKILTKLMDCSERLQLLAKQQAELEQQEQERERHQSLMGLTHNHQRRRSRVNSWLGGKLPWNNNLPNKGSSSTKLRLHSLVPTLTTPSNCSPNSTAQNRSDHHQQQRRHTAIAPASGTRVVGGGGGGANGGFSLCGGGADGGRSGDNFADNPRAERGGSFLAPDLPDAAAAAAAAAHHHHLLSRDAIGRHSTKERRRPTEFLLPDAGRLNCCNKSDFNINYHDTVESGEMQPLDYIVMNQLQVPSTSGGGGGGGGPSTTQHLQSHPFAGSLSTSSLCKTTQIRSSQSSHSPTRICIETGDGDIIASTKQNTNADKQRRRSSIKTPYQHHRHHHHHHHHQHHNHNNHHYHHHHQRKHVRPTTVSLKEINRRRIRVKFSTRRQLSDKYLNYLNNSNNNNANNSGNPSKYCSESESEEEKTPPQLPDSIMVVYSVNDRESFNYAKTLVNQLRLIKEKQELPLPIILVANKIDLERAKVVRPEEARALAKRNGCKYMEISCTVGFRLDNLLVGLRTQLVLKHHITLNSILKGNNNNKLSSDQSTNNKTSKNKVQKDSPSSSTAAVGVAEAEAEAASGNAAAVTTNSKSKFGSGKGSTKNSPASGNILVRFYKRYVMDDYGQDFDCDNFSKLE